MPNATKLCYNSVFLHFSSILSQLLLKIVHYFGFTHAHKPKFGLVFCFCFCFCWFISNFFSLLLLSFFSPFLFSLSSTLYHLSIHWKSFGLSPLKTWKWNIDQLCELAYFTTNFAAKIGYVFLVLNSSARIWSIFKMDTRMDGSVLAVLAAYLNNLVTSKMMTSQVAQWFPTSMSGKYNSWRKRVNSFPSRLVSSRR